MNYELAKQLYKKGSPFTSSIPVTEANMKYIYFPSLSELIEACGDKFVQIEGKFRLQKCNDCKNWIALGWSNEKMESSDGDTPEEAVAKLWLELNK